MQRVLPHDTDYFVRFHAKTADIAQSAGSAPQILNVRIIDNRTVDDRYWDPANQTWTSTPTSIAVLGGENYQAHSFTFRTDGATEFIDIRFEILNGTGIAWVDEMIVVAGTAEPAAIIWTGQFSGAGKIYGMLDNGQRVPTRADISSQDQLDDGEFYALNRFYYRKDSGAPVNAEVGRYMNAMRLYSEDATGAVNPDGVHDIVIDGIDVMGPGTRPPRPHHRPGGRWRDLYHTGLARYNREESNRINDQHGCGRGYFQR